MAVRLNVTADTRSIQRRLDQLGKDAPRAIVRALNRTATNVRAEAVRQVSRDTGLKQKDVRDRTDIKRATLNRQAAAVVASGKRLPLIAFGARQVALGVVTKLGAQMIPHAFIATMGSGHVGVFRRRFVGRGSSAASRRGPRRSQLPVVELHGPSIAGAVRKHTSALAGFAQQRMAVNLRHEIGFLARGQAAPPSDET